MSRSRLINRIVTKKGNATQRGSNVHGKATTNGTTGSQKEVYVDTFTINVFFDGTKNNLYNIENRKKNPQMYKGKETASEYESYFNDHSNVSYLYQARGQKANIGWAYIEGIGTGADQINHWDRENKDRARKGFPLKDREYHTDSQQGFAFGSGPTGIEARVFQSFEKIQTMVKQSLGDRIPTILILNIFGFSRGAAAARHFLHRVKTEPQLFKGWNLKRERIIVNFVGLFDTVSSFSAVYTIPEPTSAFDDDVKELHLNFGRNYASKVFHLTAADEYRQYFSLTNIDSAISNGFGMEVIISGAHADVGGSYQSEAQKKPFPVKKNFLGMKKWFQEQGFFKEDDIHWVKSKTYEGDFGGTQKTPETMEAIRKNIIPNDYARVAFKIMRLIVETHCSDKVIVFNRNRIKHREASHFPEIIELLNKLPYDIQKASQDSWAKRYNFELSKYYSPQQVRKIRYKYIHWSAKDETGYELRTKNGLPYRIIHKG
ncbi:T6SS phospholipase effector Tle1-like catalytic domain-containing protein [Neisseria sicca]|jgi:hypothetical protein|uniref:T6SS phospholipase effector Tle1-like catalytic domain-containing protein n=2 Tax=Neisseria TaxID=482 RepID=UPI000D301AE0|nr:DUF2235 domain-containing protein [Neisseria sicca]MBF1285257.1 DUF2235 domain-containing protein [Neisseria sp.]